jgi:hypothetical protein
MNNQNFRFELFNQKYSYEFDQYCEEHHLVQIIKDIKNRKFHCLKINNKIEQDN